ncbi:hypothetical protein [Spiroplasma ixodetis]|uniref:hypothetical protein n=1 Tax=Spiroplasma ixodetis TaxID=2141 RepID=UPI002575E73D|nr:hypothetical protein [Spiroplasma ixodetis]WJG69776.1 hypothetical protein SIXOD_v1c07320 [Spiroplasma ixodetis Y32]
MKNLVKLLSILTIWTPIPLSVVACDNNTTQKIELKDKITKLTTNITVDVNKSNKKLDTLINNTTEVKNLNPKLVNPVIKYFSDAQGKNDVSNQNQKAGDLYVIITADINDANYQGSTAPIKINIKEQSEKTDLSTITQLTGLDIIANPSKSYKELISNINSFDEFKSTPLAVGYQLQFYNENNEEITNIKQELEKVSKIFVKISSNSNDPNYQGSTMIDISKQTIISDIDMQNYFAKTTLPFASLVPENPSTPATSDKQQAIVNVTDSLKKIQKKFEYITKSILKGMYKEKIDFNKLTNKNEIYDVNEKPVSNNWFENKETKKPALIIIFYGSVKEEDGYFFPIWINIT